MIFFSELPAFLGGSILQVPQDAGITLLTLDSRKAIPGKGTLFFAIRGERHDGHVYLAELYQRGIRQFVVEQPVAAQAFPEANIIQVPSAVDALQRLAAHHRAKFSLPVVGITGSNGKTIIKEWLFQMLSKYLSIVKNPGSYNSQVGVPLSVWQMQEHHQLGIFEAGISRPGEMEKLAAIIRPTVGVFSTIGPAHDEGFVSMTDKIQEKLLLFNDASVIVYCKDHEAIDAAISSLHKTTFTWGRSADVDILVVPAEQGGFAVSYRGQVGELRLPFSDQASVENCFHCVAVMVWMGYSLHQVQEAINSLRVVPMRLELKEGINHCQLIDDTYNNDLGGLEISLQFLAHQHQRTRKRVILSDILESGLTKTTLAEQVSDLLAKHQIHQFIGVGPMFHAYQQLFPAGSLFYTSTEEFLERFDTTTLYEEIILVKGARPFQFERIVNQLQRRVHGTVMEVDLGALVHNLNFFRARLQPTTKIMVMVKAFAYGSGSNEVANMLQYHKVDYLGVAYADEGVELRRNNITLPIMVMNPSEESFATLVSYNLEPEIYSFRILAALLKFLNNKPCRIHLKLDTGMRRLGFEGSELDELIAILKANPQLTVATIFSHLAGADEHEHDDFSHAQAGKFATWATTVANAIGQKPVLHILNSPGILRLPELQLDMVRLGIGLYGIDPTAEATQGLRPVATLKTIISQLKHIRAGESIGYGRRGRATADMTVATIAIGYADGFSRAFSRGVGKVLIRGQRAPVIGNVCMDMTMVDVTGTGAREGDEVILFGGALSIQDVAKSINTIPYEILTNTRERIKRIFVAEGI
jgi:alanine racemase